MRTKPRNALERIAYEIVLPIWDELTERDFWFDGFDAFYWTNDLVCLSVSVTYSVCYDATLCIEYGERHEFSLSDPESIHKAQQKLIELIREHGKDAG